MAAGWIWDELLSSSRLYHWLLCLDVFLSDRVTNGGSGEELKEGRREGTEEVKKEGAMDGDVDGADWGDSRVGLSKDKHWAVS